MNRPPLPTVGLLFFSGCFLLPASADRSKLPQDSVLAGAAPAERARLSVAHTSLGHAQSQLAISQRHQQQSLDVQAAGKHRRDDAHDRVKLATNVLDHSERTGSITGISVARTGLHDAEAVEAVEAARGVLFAREVDHASRQTSMAEANVDVATAQLDLARAQAANTIDRVDMPRPDVDLFAAVVRRFEGRAVVARVDLVAAEHEVAVSRAKLQERENER